MVGTGRGGAAKRGQWFHFSGQPNVLPSCCRCRLNLHPTQHQLQLGEQTYTVACNFLCLCFLFFQHMSRHSRIQEATNLNRGPPLPDSFSLNSGTSFIATNLPSTQDHSYLDNPSAIPPASATFLQHKVEHVISTQNTINAIKSSINNNIRKPAVAYTGLTGAGYTLSGQTGRFLLPANSVARPQDGAGTLDVWPAGKSALSASSAANKQERKRHRNRAKGSGSSSGSSIHNNNNNSSSSGGVQHETGSQPKLLQELDQFITSELNVLGIDCGSSSEPNAARLQVYREAFRHFMEEFKTYKPFLSSVKNEYDSVLDKYAR